MMKRPIFMIALACITFPGMTFAGDSLQSFKGTWKGEGWARQSPGAPRENVRCRLKASYIPPSNRLVIKGKCAVPGRSFNMKGTVSEKQGGKISGRWSNPFGPGSKAIAGTVDAKGIALNVSVPVRRGGHAQPHRMVWSKTNNGFVLTNQNLATADLVSEVVFKR